MAVLAAVCRWRLCPCCPGVGRRRPRILQVESLSLRLHRRNLPSLRTALGAARLGEPPPVQVVERLHRALRRHPARDVNVGLGRGVAARAGAGEEVGEAWGAFPAKAACGAAQRGERTHGIMKDGWVAVRAANTLTPRLSSSSTGGSEDGTGGTSVGIVFSPADSGAGRYCRTPVSPQSEQSFPSSHLMTETARGPIFEPSSQLPSFADAHVSVHTAGGPVNAPKASLLEPCIASLRPLQSFPRPRTRRPSLVLSFWP